MKRAPCGLQLAHHRNAARHSKWACVAHAGEPSRMHLATRCEKTRVSVRGVHLPRALPTPARLTHTREARREQAAVRACGARLLSEGEDGDTFVPRALPEIRAGKFRAHLLARHGWRRPQAEGRQITARELLT